MSATAIKTKMNELINKKKEDWTFDEWQFFIKINMKDYDKLI